MSKDVVCYFQFIYVKNNYCKIDITLADGIINFNFSVYKGSLVADSGKTVDVSLFIERIYLMTENFSYFL